MATVPTLLDWTQFTVPTAARFNNELRDPTSLCVNPNRALVYHTGTNQNLSCETWTLMQWNQEDADTEAMHDTVTNNSRIVGKTAGRFQIYASCRWEWFTDVGSSRCIMVRLNSGGVIGGGSEVCSDRRRGSDFIGGSTNYGIGCQSLTGFVSLNGTTDYIECFAWQGQRNSPFNTAQTSHIWAVPDPGTPNTVRLGMVWISSL